jgi:hypothetical protein
MDINRRSVTKTSGVGMLSLLAGCNLPFIGGNELPNTLISNNTQNVVTVDLEFYKSGSDKVVVARSYDLDPDEIIERELIPEPGQYTLVLTTSYGLNRNTQFDYNKGNQLAISMYSDEIRFSTGVS